jgi:subtilisin family serine protease/peroxiredoxin
MRYRALLSGFLIMIFITSLAQDTATPKYRNWHLADKVVDGYFGISWQKAYELVKDRKSNSVIVAVIDGGTDTAHKALRESLWINSKETPGNDKDDDRNGYVDDINGWDFIGGKGDTTVEEDSYEYQRVYFADKDKYERFFQPKKLHGDDSVNYIAWKTAAKLYQRAIRPTDEYLLMQEEIIAADSLLRLRMKMEYYTESGLQALPVKDNIQGRARNLILHCFDQLRANQCKDNKDMIIIVKGWRETALKSLEAARRPPSEYRNNIVKDDYTNLNDRYYGNNDIMGGHSRHGTAVAGIIKGLNSEGGSVKGVHGTIRLMILRVVPNGDEHDKDIALAIHYAVDNGARIINMSFCKPISPQKKWVDEAVRYAAERNVLLVHAAGNDAQNIDSIPFFPNPYYGNKPSQRASNWIEVGASGDSSLGGLAAGFSNYGKEHADVFAPGVVIYYCVPSPGTNSYLDGTSLAAPIVSGMAAFILSYYPELSAGQLKQIIEGSVEKPNGLVNRPGSKDKVPFGELCRSGGIVNLYNAILSIRQNASVDSELNIPMEMANDFARRTGAIKTAMREQENTGNINNLYDSLAELGRERERVFRLYMQTHPRSIALPCAIRLAGMDQSEKQAAYIGLNERQKGSEYGLTLKRELDRSVAYTGKLAPKFILPLRDGKPYSLQKAIDKKQAILLDFWASWCGPCRRELLVLKVLYRRLHALGFDILSVSIDKDPKAWKQALAEENLPWPNLIDTASKVYHLYGGEMVPRQVLLDKQGRVLEWDPVLGIGKLEEKIRQCLKQ